MCGDLDEEGQSESELYARYIAHARAFLARRSQAGSTTPASELHAYMDRLLSDALVRCTRDTEETDENGRYRLLSVQPLVFARLAGFLAGHVSLQEEPLRKAIEALMHGYAEAETIEPDHGHEHEHGHEHDDHHHHEHGHHH